MTEVFGLSSLQGMGKTNDKAIYNNAHLGFYYYVITNVIYRVWQSTIKHYLAFSILSLRDSICGIVAIHNLAFQQAKQWNLGSLRCGFR